LKLATGYLPFSGVPDWKITFDDPEQTVSLHRWNWLLIKLAEEPFPEVQQWGLELMRDWIAKMDHKSGLPWESYTTGERISNAILFVNLSDRENEGLASLPEDLAPAVRAMACFLAERLEYHGPQWTGNHVINNARALYLAGCTLKEDCFIDLAVAIFRNNLRPLISSSGFLREGSSHYHFLITRWLLEVLWIARLSKDEQTIGLIEPTAKLMVERCWFFLVFQTGTGDWQMPLIGDVSPDFSWRWLIDLPWSSFSGSLYAPEKLPLRPKVRGWGGLFDTHENDGRSLSGVEEVKVPTLHSFAADGWYRLDWGRLNIFWHVEPSGTPPFASHGHCDTGSFCLYWDGEEILTDSGRFNYDQSDPLGNLGLSAGAHNSVLIDGFEPFVYKDRNRYPDFYLQGKVSVRCEEDRDSFKMFLWHTGFSRLHGDKIIFSRAYLVSRNQLIIEDNFQGSGRHSIETYFQWAPGLEVKEKDTTNTFTIRSKTSDFQAGFSVVERRHLDERTTRMSHDLLCGQLEPAPGGWYFPEYGMKRESPTIGFKHQTSLPFENQYILNWAN
jgi:hypothetical protein